MFTSLDKAIIALVMAVVYLLREFVGVNLGIDEATVTTWVMMLTPILVWVIPNKKPA